MIKKVTLYFYTVRYLKPIQIFYQVFYIFLNSISRKPLDLSKRQNLKFTYLKYTISLENSSYKGDNKFIFLNISHQFEYRIDWELMEYGKLWQYNLAYFDFLNNSNLNKANGLLLINNFIDSQNQLKSCNEPYPISLRLINWIRFVNIHQIDDSRIIDAIYNQAKRLLQRLEYHLLGNHLLENGFCLLHIAKFFSNEYFYQIATKILFKQLNEQILPDGGHFELSPMYHQIIFFRVLESIDLLKNNFEEKDKNLVEFLELKAKCMLSWLDNITFHNGDIPLLNDSANGIAPTTNQLRFFAQKLNIYSSNIPLNESGYRKFQNKHYEAILDVGNVGPTYQPGHAHADMLNLIVYLEQKPFLIETGTSTYQINARRHLERSTESHNTVVVDDQNQSQVWSGFRVAKRAKIKLIKDEPAWIIAQHNGFGNVQHLRQVEFSEKKIVITDKITGNCKKTIAYLHFDPNFSLEIISNTILFDGGKIILKNAKDTSLEDYHFAPKFNVLVLSKKLKIFFEKELETQIYFDTK
jgi:hypothetical protein